MAIARVANPSTWRTQASDASVRGDRKALRELANSPAVKRLPTSSLLLIASALTSTGMGDRAVDLLRKVQRERPGDFWTNLELGLLLCEQQQPRHDQAIHYFAIAVALRPASPGARLNFGSALYEKGQLEEAIAEFREAIRLKKDLPLAHNNLGLSLKAKGLLDDAIEAYHKAIDLDPKCAPAHVNLGNALREKGRLDDAIAEYREAIRIKPDSAEAHYNLGCALSDTGSVDERIAEYRKAIRIKHDYAEAHYNLANALSAEGDIDGAMAEYREAILLNKHLSKPRNNLGNILRKRGDLNGAIAEFRQAINLKNDNPEAHFSLAQALRDQGRFAESLEAVKRGHELRSRYPRWLYPSAQYLHDCEYLLELDRKLPAFLSGELEPANLAERICLAQLCHLPCKKLYATAARLYAEAFAANPPPADQPVVQRYNAAGAAALASCGQGKDADQTDDKERVRLRRQALEWLRADLAAWRQLLEKEPDKARPVVRRQMRHWQQDKDFAGVRGPEALAKLPEGERQDWQKLWEEVEALAKRAAPPKRELVPPPEVSDE